MKAYNLYYKNTRLNKQPISIEELQNIKNAKAVSKIDYDKKTVQQIPLNMVRIVECIVL